MDNYKKTFLYSFIITAMVTTAFLAGLVARDYLPLPGFERPEFPVLQQAHGLLLEHGFEDPPAGPALEYGMIRGMLQAYDDPYTSFLEPVQSQLEGHTLQGRYGGIGANLGVDGEGFVVLFPFPDSPAFLAGILEGDRLLQVDDLQVRPDTPTDTVVAAMRGPVGRKAAITIARPPDYREQNFSITREEIPLPSVTGHLEPTEPRLGVVKVNVIAASTAGEISTTIDDLLERGATHIVLDLRDNGGGLLSAGVDVARLFLEEGDIMQQEYQGHEVETYRVERPGPLVDLPLAILTNHNTASAAEIVAGALQVNQRAVLLGSHTFGKNWIQLLFTLQDGSSLHITAARWWVPGLEFPTEHGGLLPDIPVADDPENPQALIQAAIQSLFGEH